MSWRDGIWVIKKEEVGYVSGSSWTEVLGTCLATIPSISFVETIIEELVAEYIHSALNMDHEETIAI